MTNSREIATRFGKKNKDVNEAIRSIIKRNPELSQHFAKSFYVSSRVAGKNRNTKWMIMVPKF